MADSIYVKVGNEVEQLDLGGGSSPEYVERIEALEAYAEGQAQKDEAQDEAIEAAQSSADAAGQAAAAAQSTADAAGDAAAAAQSTADAAGDAAAAANSAVSSLATVAKTGSYNDLSNKPSIPASPKAYVTTTYNSGTTGYRKWSDGFIEQWGRGVVTANTSGSNTVTFPTAFSTTNYHLSTHILQGGVRRWAFAKTLTKTTFTYSVTDYSGTGSANSTLWYACGY